MRTGIAITNADRTNGDNAATADMCTAARQTRGLRALAQVMDGTLSRTDGDQARTG